MAPDLSHEISPLDPRGRDFAGQLDWHLAQGTRPGSARSEKPAAWTNASFATAIGLDERTIRNWRKARAVPIDLRPIERSHCSPRVRFIWNGCGCSAKLTATPGVIRQGQPRSRAQGMAAKPAAVPIICLMPRLARCSKAAKRCSTTCALRLPARAMRRRW